ncbi:MAG TPA: glutathione S-transferase family protein [Polyangiales bacterium]|nr:glutathione S-transferase family protein [Polyangiales bacterium]
MLLFCAEADIAYEPVVVDSSSRERSFDVRTLMPTLEADGCVLDNAADILRHLASGFGSSLYPGHLHESIDARMAWLHAGFYRDFGSLVGPAEPASETTGVRRLTGRRDQMLQLLMALDRGTLRTQRYLVGDSMTIADCLGAPIFGLDELLDIRLDHFPNVARWIAALRRRPNWKKVHAPSTALAAAPGWDWRSGYGASQRRSLALSGSSVSSVIDSDCW